MPDYVDQFPLLKWFKIACEQHLHTKFPGSGNTNYWTLFESIHQHLNQHVHPTVEAAAAAAEGGAIYLTRHGPEHIKVVIQRAELLIATLEYAANPGGTEYSPCLEPYEVFVLLMAIHFHDLANRSGRSGHEARIFEEVKTIHAVRQIDDFHLRAIVKIASCHGGKVKGDRDKIGRLLSPRSHSGPISYRPQLIAAILKLADELADDRTRADLHGLANPSTFPKESLLFHTYAAALESVSLDAATGTILLNLKFSETDAFTQFEISTHTEQQSGSKPPHSSAAPSTDAGIWKRFLRFLGLIGESQVNKQNAETPPQVSRPPVKSNVYLLDYIYERTLKTYRELIYCTRFMRQLPVNYHEVKVIIEIFRDDSDVEGSEDLDPIERIQYVIGNTGYPDDRHGDLKSLASDFDPTLTGKAMVGKLRSKHSGPAATKQ